MSEQHLPKSDAKRAEQALTIVRYILDLPNLYAKAVVYNFPYGTVLGRRQSLLDIDTDAIGHEVNASIEAIGGIPAIIESPDTVTYINLVQWLGPHNHDQSLHRWIGQVADTKAHVSAPIRGVEADLLSGQAT